MEAVLLLQMIHPREMIYKQDCLLGKRMGGRGISEGLFTPMPANNQSSFFFLEIYLSLFLVALGLCCARAFSNCSERELLFIVVHGLLIAVASLVVEHRLQ